MKRQTLHLVLMTVTIVASANIASVFAMHDSNLDVNTWIASDNSTQLQTTDLNRGPISPALNTGAETLDETNGPSTDIPTTPDETEEDVGSEDVDESEDEEESGEDDDDDT